jgi:flagellar basal-body rod protein FlgB
MAFVERLLNQGNAPLLERVLQFTGERQRLIGENIVNLSTPGYKQKDLSVERFQKALRDRVERKNNSGPGSVGFKDIDAELEKGATGLLFHDGNDRSVEGLMTESAKNALMHNLVVELLRKQFGAMENALKERIG